MIKKLTLFITFLVLAGSFAGNAFAGERTKYVIFYYSGNSNGGSAESAVITTPLPVTYDSGATFLFAPYDTRQNVYNLLTNYFGKFYEPSMTEHFLNSYEEAEDYVKTWFDNKVSTYYQNETPKYVYIIDPKTGVVQDRHTIAAVPKRRSHGAVSAR